MLEHLKARAMNHRAIQLMRDRYLIAAQADEPG